MSYTSIDCPHCRAEHIGARITSGAQLPDKDGEARYFFVAVCRKCGFPTIIVARRSAARLADGPPLVKHVCRTERDPVPNIIESVEMIPAAGTAQAPDALPANVASAYAEAQECLQRGAVISAALGMRMTLERATRVLNCDAGLTLAERIAALVDAGALPPVLGNWAREIGLIRGGPADQDADPSTGELRSAGFFTETFLTCAFTLPARIDQHRKLASRDREEGAGREAAAGGEPEQLPVPGRTPGQGQRPRTAANGI